MKLKHYFKLICVALFQDRTKLKYDKTIFYCPKIRCNDGFSVSLQIHCTNYCSSENGYRRLGFDWQEVEFGFPIESEPLMVKYAEIYDGDDSIDITNTVGRIPLDVMQEVVDKHGGIDWDATLDNKLLKEEYLCNFDKVDN